MSKARDLADFVSAGNPLADGTIDVADINGLTASTTELNILDGATLSTTELNYVAGVTSSVQTQLGTKANTADLGTAASLDTGTSAGNVVILDGSAKLPAVDGSQLTNIQGYSIASALAFE